MRAHSSVQAPGVVGVAIRKRQRRGVGEALDLTSRRGTIISIASSGGARFLVLPISAILGIIVTRLIIGHYGVDTYAQYILLVGIAGLIPFSDLGLTAAIMNAVSGADDPRTDPHLHLVLVSCMRLLAVCATVVIGVAFALYFTGLWPTLLGSGLTPQTGALAATLCLAVFGANILIAYGQRILAALGLNFLVVLLGALQTPIVLAALWFMIRNSLNGGFIPVVSYLATTVICVISIIVAGRKIRPMLRTSLRSAVNPHIKGARVFNTAWPMLIQMIALPLGMSSDRLALSLVGTVKDLSEYSLANQLFSPVLAVVSAANFSLWPVFAKARAANKRAPVSPGKMSIVFAGAAVLACLVLGIAASWLTRLASGGKIHLSLELILVFSAFIVIQSMQYPLGMYLSDASGLRFQAFCILAMMPVNLGLTVLLIPSLGPIGPLIGSIVGSFFFLLIPNWWLVDKRLRKLASHENAKAISTGPGSS